MNHLYTQHWKKPPYCLHCKRMFQKQKYSKKTFSILATHLVLGECNSDFKVLIRYVCKKCRFRIKHPNCRRKATLRINSHFDFHDSCLSELLQNYNRMIHTYDGTKKFVEKVSKLNDSDDFPELPPLSFVKRNTGSHYCNFCNTWFKTKRETLDHVENIHSMNFRSAKSSGYFRWSPHQRGYRTCFRQAKLNFPHLPSMQHYVSKFRTTFWPCPYLPRTKFTSSWNLASLASTKRNRSP